MLGRIGCSSTLESLPVFPRTRLDVVLVNIRQPVIVRGMKRCFDRYFADYEAKTSSMFIRLSRFFISTLMVLQRAGNEKVGPFLPPSLQPNSLPRP